MMAKDYKGTPIDYLPYPPTTDRDTLAQTEIGDGLALSIETIEILLSEIDRRAIPAIFVTQIFHLLPKWRNQLESRGNQGG